MDELINVQVVRKGLAIVTLQRPERRNALCIAMLKQLCDHMERLSRLQEARVVILQGAGPVFSSGLDLSEASNPELVEESAHCVARALYTMQHSPLVSIAAVHGGAYAGGAGLMAACDIAVGAEDVKIGFPEARRGLLPALISEVLCKKLREGDLRELFLVGNPIDARHAFQIGLLQRVTPVNRVIDTAIELAMGVLAGGPQTIADTKKLLNHAYGHDVHGSSTPQIEDHLLARRSPEAAEGLAAFLEKRMPAWMVD